jgi:hypothetical protein
LPIFNGAPASVDHVLLKGQPKSAKLAKDENEAADVDELWKLAERMGAHQEESPAGLPLEDFSNESQGGVHNQSAEEALAALQALAARAPQTTQDSAADGDLLAELSRMEFSLEALPQLDSLPVDLAAEMGPGGLDEAPELELDALEPPEANPVAVAAPNAVVQAPALDAIDAPDLALEDLLEAQAETLEPPELAADFDAEHEESLEPPDVVLEQLLAAPDASVLQAYELSDPPEPADFGPAATEETAVPAVPASAPVVRRAHNAAPKLRPATELQEMSPSPNLPEGGYALKPWTDALAIAGPDRSRLLSPAKFLEMRKSSLNGTSAAKFDPVQFQASESIAAIPVPISEPSSSAVSYESQDDALTPAAAFAWPAPLHAVLFAAEMRLNGTSEGISVRESFFSVKQPPLSGEFLSKVALQSRILEPTRSVILSPPERGAYTSAPAEEEESGGRYASAAGRSDRDETEGGERAHVADLF